VLVGKKYRGQGGKAPGILAILVAGKERVSFGFLKLASKIEGAEVI